MMCVVLSTTPLPPRSTLFPYTTLFRSDLHIVVCCAGILKERMIFNMSEEEWDSVVAVHLKGHFTVMRPATRHMREHKYGRLVTRSEEHTSELQSRFDLVCRLLLEKKNK